jgi:BTB/POZ domain
MSNSRDPDVVIVASDGVQLRVSKSLLSQASPVFSDMFSVPQPDSSLAPNDPINLSEPSQTIKLMLSLANSPPTLLLIDSLSEIANLLQAADKYDIKTIQEHAIYSLRQPKFLENEPLRVYAIASRYGAHDTAVLAAQNTLRYPLMHAAYFSELEMVDGGTIYRVFRFHKQCTAAAERVATDHTWIKDTYGFFSCPKANSGEDGDNDGEDNKGFDIHTISSIPSRKYKHGYLKRVYVHRWWTKFMDTTKVALSESPYSETIRDKSRVMEALSSASQCSHCRRCDVKSDFTRFLDAFVDEVEARVKEVSAYVPFF